MAHSDNLSDKWEQYFSIYEAELRPLLSAAAPIRLLEIGIQNGGSLQIWQKYLPADSHIVGIDVDPKCASLRMPAGIDIFIGDASDPATLDDRLANLTFDVIVDDGSHRSEHVVATFKACFPRLKPGGVYIVEDLHCSYWPSHGGGLCNPASSVAFFKSLADALHADHIAEDDIRGLSHERAIHLTAFGREIARITFYDSVAVIVRLPEGKTRPFARMLTGGHAPVLDPSPYLPHMPLPDLRSLTLTPAADAVFGPGLRAALLAMREELDATQKAEAAAQASAEAEAKQAAERAAELAGLREQHDALRLSEAALRARSEAKSEQVATLSAELAVLREQLTAARQAEAMLRARAEDQQARDALRVQQAEDQQVRDSLRLRQVEEQQARDATRLQQAEQQAAALGAELAVLRNANSIRAALYLANRFRRLPAPVRRALRGIATTALGRSRRSRGAGLHPAPDSAFAYAPRELLPTAGAASSADVATVLADEPAEPVYRPVEPPDQPSVSQLLAQQFPTLEPYPCFPIPAGTPRLSIVTDSIGASSLFGGVGTSVLLGAALANRLGATLRIVTRMERADAAPVADVLASAGIRLDNALELAMAPMDGGEDLATAPDELFLTTSWWTTRATLGAADPSRIIALVQEDERMFYAQGDERLRCSETLDHPDLLTVVNTEALFRHLTTGPIALRNLARHGLHFEPAFPGIDDPLPGAPSPRRKRRLFFYARPHNLRNLFWRGLEALDEAAAQGVFGKDWELHWVGRDLPQVRLGGGVVPLCRPPMPWSDYQRFIRTMDAGFVLMDTPHPSYPPLDLAAAGAAVLTTVHPGKENLAQYSDNILMAEPSRDALVQGLRRLVQLGQDDAARARNRSADHIQRDWARALAPVVDQLAATLAG